MRAAMTQALSTRDFLQLVSKMNEAKLYPLVVKGLLQENFILFPDERVSGDEDLLITKELFPTYHQFFTEHNLVTGDDLEPYEVPYQLKGVHFI